MLGVGLNYGSGWGFCFDVGFGFGVCLICFDRRVIVFCVGVSFLE